jgi:hypothetical protein
MKRKDVEDIIGGKDAWENVDKTNGRGSFGWPLELYAVLTLRSAMSKYRLPARSGVLLPAADPQCRRADDQFLQGMPLVLPGERRGYIVLLKTNRYTVHEMRKAVERVDWRSAFMYRDGCYYGV